MTDITSKWWKYWSRSRRWLSGMHGGAGWGLSDQCREGNVVGEPPHCAMHWQPCSEACSTGVFLGTSAPGTTAQRCWNAVNHSSLWCTLRLEKQPAASWYLIWRSLLFATSCQCADGNVFLFNFPAVWKRCLTTCGAHNMPLWQSWSPGSARPPGRVLHWQQGGMFLLLTLCSLIVFCFCAYWIPGFSAGLPPAQLCFGNTCSLRSGQNAVKSQFTWATDNVSLAPTCVWLLACTRSEEAFKPSPLSESDISGLPFRIINCFIQFLMKLWAKMFKFSGETYSWTYLYKPTMFNVTVTYLKLLSCVWELHIQEFNLYPDIENKYEFLLG